MYVMKRGGGATFLRLSLFAIAFLCITALAYAQQSQNTILNPIGSPTFEAAIKRVTTWAAAIAVPLTTLMVLIAGLLYMTAGGDPEKIKRAHKALTWAAVGFGVVLFSTVAYILIQNFLGVV